MSCWAQCEVWNIKSILRTLPETLHITLITQQSQIKSPMMITVKQPIHFLLHVHLKGIVLTKLTKETIQRAISLFACLDYFWEGEMIKWPERETAQRRYLCQGFAFTFPHVTSIGVSCRGHSQQIVRSPFNGQSLASHLP